MSLLRRRAARRSCAVHGDNGCELTGEAGPRTRAQDTRAWHTDLADEVPSWAVMGPGIGEHEIAQARLAGNIEED